MKVTEVINRPSTVMANVCEGETFLYNGNLYMCIDCVMLWNSDEEEYNNEANAVCLANAALSYIPLADMVYPVEAAVSYS